MKILPLLTVLGAPLLAQSGSAALFEFNLVRREPSDFHQSFTFDASTGKYYQRPGLGFTGQTLTEFENAAAFEANTPSSSVALQDGYYGTYVAANGGKLFGRTELLGDFSGSASSRFDLATGQIEHTQAFPNLGRNGDDTFAWGGLTSINFYSDSSGLYSLGKSDASPQTWQLSRLNSDLGIIESKTFEASEIGYAVMINGQLFIGQHTFTPEGELVTDGFSSVFDYAAGTYQSTSHEFDRLGGLQYLDNVVYDYTTDTLYAHNRAGTGEAPAFYKMGDVSKVLSGEVVHHIPETMNTLLGLGLAAGAMLLISRPAQSAKS